MLDWNSGMLDDDWIIDFQMPRRVIDQQMPRFITDYLVPK